MLLRSLSAFCLVLASTACEKAPAQTDVLAESRDVAVGRTVQCTEPVSDGTCNEKTCKKDARSDCADFGKACIDGDHKYEGTRDEGTCTRVKINI